MEERKPAYPRERQVMVEVGAVECVCYLIQSALWCLYLSERDLMLGLFFVCGSMTERWPLCVHTPTGSRFHQMERWGWPMWASLMQAAIRALLGIDLARRVRLEGSLSPVCSAAKEQNVCECHLVSKICCSIKINTGGSYCSKRPWVNNWWAENRSKLSVLLWGAFAKPLVPSGA